MTDQTLTVNNLVNGINKLKERNPAFDFGNFVLRSGGETIKSISVETEGGFFIDLETSVNEAEQTEGANDVN